jgi:VanZ family protein
VSRRLLAPLALMGVIFAFSAQPGGEQLEWWEVVIRKLGHFGIYALLAGLWFWALAGRVRRPLLWACGISLAYACTDEFHQTFVEGRHGSPVDVLIDAAGIATAAAAVALLVLPRSSPAR